LRDNYKSIIEKSNLGIVAKAEAIAITGFNMVLLPKAGKVVKIYLEQVN